MQNQPKMPGGDEEQQDFLQNLNDLGGVYGLDHIRQNLDSIAEEQVPELIDGIKAMDRDPASKDFDKINELMGVVLQGLQDKLPDPEARNEGESVAPELSVVGETVASPEVAAAEERLDHISEIFDTERGYFNASTLRKVEKWQAELDQMADLLGNDKIGPLYSQLEKFKDDAEVAQRARKVVSSQPSVQRPAAKRAGGRVQRPSAVAPARKPFWKFW